MPCRMDNTAFAEIEWQFQIGAYSNPPGQVHFFEHFINKKIRSLAEQNDVHLRASTSQTELNESIKGTANPNSTDYGIWQILPFIRKSLENPLPENEKDIENEKKVVADEIRRYDRDHDFLVGKHFREKIYAKENPYRNEPAVTGTKEDLEKIKLSSLKKLAKKVLIPDGLLINIYTEGGAQNTKMLSDKVESLFEDFPREDKKHLKQDLKIREKMNPDFKSGQISISDTHLNNGQVTTQFAWIFEREFPTVSYFSLKDLSILLDLTLHEYSRKVGWGYYTASYIVTPGDNKSIFVLRVDTGEQSDPKKFAEGILKEILKNVIPIKKERLKLANEIEIRRQKAVPLNNRDRLSWVFDGIKDHGQIIDAGKIREIRTKVGFKDLQDWIDILLSVPPAILITGNLS